MNRNENSDSDSRKYDFTPECNNIKKKINEFRDLIPLASLLSFLFFQVSNHKQE